MYHYTKKMILKLKKDLKMKLLKLCSLAIAVIPSQRVPVLIYKNMHVWTPLICSRNYPKNLHP